MQFHSRRNMMKLLLIIVKTHVSSSSCNRCLHLSIIAIGKKKPLKPPPKNFMKFPVKSSIQFVARQLADPYVKKRITEGYRCRSVYKLKEIDEKHCILKPGMSVVDLGAAPGSWCQAASEKIHLYGDDGVKVDGSQGQIIAVDLLKFPPLDGVTQVIGDFTDPDIQQKVVGHLSLKGRNKGKADIVLCDAAPNATGIKSQDHILIKRLATNATNFALKILKPGGTFLFKLWDGSETVKLRNEISTYFSYVKNIKPPASRGESAEIYILCQKLRLPGMERTTNEEGR